VAFEQSSAQLVQEHPHYLSACGEDEVEETCVQRELPGATRSKLVSPEDGRTPDALARHFQTAWLK
jgi:hypothetical protein